MFISQLSLWVTVTSQASQGEQLKPPHAVEQLRAWLCHVKAHQEGLRVNQQS